VTAAFPTLARHPGATVVVMPMAGAPNQPWDIYWVSERLFKFALKRALSEPPFNMGVVEGPAGRSIANPTRDSIESFVDSAGIEGDFVVLFKVKPAGDQASVRVVLYDVKGEEALQFEQTISGQNGLVTLSPLVLLGGGVAALLIILLGGFFVARTFLLSGTVIVDLKGDNTAEREVLALVLSKKAQAPSIKDIQWWDDKIKARGPKQAGRTYFLPSQRSKYVNVPRGAWNVHVYGTSVRAGELREIVPMTRTIDVKRGEEVVVAVSLEPNQAEFRISVIDGKPLAGAVVYFDEGIGRTKTDADGNATIMIGKGVHVLHVEHRDTNIQREITVLTMKVQVLTIDLEYERKMGDRKAGIAIDGFEQAPPEPPSAPSANGNANGNGNGHAAEIAVPDEDAPRVYKTRDDDGISLPGIGGGGVQVAEPSIAPGAGRSMPPPIPGGPPGRKTAAKGAVAGLARYRREQELGRGAMGVVYKAKDTVLEREVALKLVGDDVKQHPAALEMFLQEAKSLAALNHPNIVTVFDQGQDEDETFMVMEFVKGTTLDQIISQRGKLPIDQALEFGEQVCAGLGYAHEERIIHRDIKPANIFVTKDGVVKIGDFGLARVTREVNVKQTKVCGTPLYMSPEQIRGTDLDFRSDLYSLGCMLFELLTGKPPFTTGEVLYHHMYTPPPAATSVEPTLPPQIDQLLKACLEKDKDTRVASAQQLRDMIKGLRKELRI
jgi:predicted Ser/Thr protein kinase